MTNVLLVNTATRPEPSRPDTPHEPTNSAVGVVRELWHSRDLVLQFALRDLTIRYVQAMMGFAWALLMPLLIVEIGRAHV